MSSIATAVPASLAMLAPASTRATAQRRERARLAVGCFAFGALLSLAAAVAVHATICPPTRPATLTPQQGPLRAGPPIATDLP